MNKLINEKRKFLTLETTESKRERESSKQIVVTQQRNSGQQLRELADNIYISFLLRNLFNKSQ